MPLAVENTLANPRVVTTFAEISEVRKQLQNLREEALGWHHTANEKEKRIAQLLAEIRQKNIEIEALNARISTLACENVRLLNKDAMKTLRQYNEPTDTISNE
jgi:uncharacterized coiled-coil DUF342 family protein